MIDAETRNLLEDIRALMTGWTSPMSVRIAYRIDAALSTPEPAASDSGLYVTKLEAAAEMLWTVVANASFGDWSKQSKDWQMAAERWRDNYFAALTYKEAQPNAAQQGKLCLSAKTVLNVEGQPAVAAPILKPDPNAPAPTTPPTPSAEETPDTSEADYHRFKTAITDSGYGVDVVIFQRVINERDALQRENAELKRRYKAVHAEYKLCRKRLMIRSEAANKAEDERSALRAAMKAAEGEFPTFEHVYAVETKDVLGEVPWHIAKRYYNLACTTATAKLVAKQVRIDELERGLK